MNINKDNPVMVTNITTPDFGGAAASDEFVIFIAPFDCFIRNIYITSNSAANKPKLNFWKGVSGDNKSIHSGFNTALSARVPVDIGELDSDNRYIPKGTTITAKEATGTADAVAPTFTTVFQRA